jgi:hypothetical protein
MPPEMIYLWAKVIGKWWSELFCCQWCYFSTDLYGKGLALFFMIWEVFKTLYVLMIFISCSTVRIPKHVETPWTLQICKEWCCFSPWLFPLCKKNPWYPAYKIGRLWC